MSDSEKYSVMEVLGLFEADIYKCSKNLDDIIKLGFQVARKQQYESV